MKTLSIALACLAFAASGAQAASMYKCVETGGKVSYADHPCADSSKEAWSSRLGSRKTPRQIAPPAPAKSDKPRPQEMARLTTAARGSDAALIDALRVDEMTRILGQQPD